MREPQKECLFFVGNDKSGHTPVSFQLVNHTVVGNRLAIGKLKVGACDVAAVVLTAIIIVDNDYIWKLNKEYRKIDRPTDVITFALEDYEDIKYEDFRLLGDIYISLDKAKEQAVEYGHSFKREICFIK